MIRNKKYPGVFGLLVFYALKHYLINVKTNVSNDLSEILCYSEYIVYCIRRYLYGES